MLDQSIQSAFDKATETLIEISLNPIAVLGKQIVSGTNYAILCYGRITESSLYSIYLITLYEDLNGKAEIVSQAYVNLSDYNK